MGLTLDQRTFASVPGEVRLNPLQYGRFFPTWPITLASALLAGVLLTVQSRFGLLIFIPALLINWLYWRHQAAHFALGCANPAKVVSLHPPLIAVYSDLTTGEHAYPVIKILRDPSVPSCVGDKYATVSLYRGSSQAERWEDFHPKPAQCATMDETALSTLKSRIPAEEWTALEEGLKQVPQPWKLGTYPIKLSCLTS
jgi:hypothetical protein